MEAFEEFGSERGEAVGVAQPQALALEECVLVGIGEPGKHVHGAQVVELVAVGDRLLVDAEVPELRQRQRELGPALVAVLGLFRQRNEIAGKQSQIQQLVNATNDAILASALAAPPALVSILLANTDPGAVPDVADWAAPAGRPGAARPWFHTDAVQALGNFEERLEVLDDKRAVAEAKRCMSCGLCFECDNCVVYCPQTAVFRVKKDKATMGRYVDTDYTKCIGCHICADVCPTGYIQMGMGE